MISRGLICGYTKTGAIPSGWIEEDRLNGKYIVEDGNGFVVGQNYGSTTHTHQVGAHGHSIPHEHRTPTGCGNTRSLGRGGLLNGLEPCHEHVLIGGVATASGIASSGTSSAVAQQPPYRTLRFIRAKSDRPNKFPDGAVTWRHITQKWDGTILLKGRYTLGDGRFAVGFTTPGVASGSFNHTHPGAVIHSHPTAVTSTHTHTLGSDEIIDTHHHITGGTSFWIHRHGGGANPASATVNGGNAASVFFTNTSEQFVPLFQSLISYQSVKSTRKDRLEAGDILMYIDTGAKFKYKNWLDCDGVNRDKDTGMLTPNLKQNRYLRYESYVGIGGEATHKHRTPATHSHQGMSISPHNHSVTTTSTYDWQTGYHDYALHDVGHGMIDCLDNGDHHHNGTSTTNGGSGTGSEEYTDSTTAWNRPEALVVGFKMATLKAEKDMGANAWIVNHLVTYPNYDNLRS